MSVESLPNQANFSGILRRVAVPFLLFALVLTMLLLLSWVLLLPRFTAITVQGNVMNTDELKDYKAELVESITTYKDTRSEFLFPLQGTSYATLAEGKMAEPKFDYLFEQVSVIAAQIVPETSDAVLVTNYIYSAEDHSVVIEGRVQKVGPSSMTILAQFVDAVSSLPHVEEAHSSKFTRIEDPSLGFISPFTINIKL